MHFLVCFHEALAVKLRIVVERAQEAILVKIWDCGKFGV